MALSLGLMVVILFSQGQPGVSLDLGVVIDSFFPGDQVELPITLVSRNEAQVGHITMEVAFPSKVISLVGVKLGNGPTAAEAEVTTELVDAPEEAGAEAETELVDAPEEAGAETETELVDAPEAAAADLEMELEEPVDLEPPSSPPEPQTYIALTRVWVYRKPTTKIARTAEFFVEAESFKVTEVIDGGRSSTRSRSVGARSRCWLKWRMRCPPSNASG